MQKMLFTLVACCILSALSAQQTVIKDPNAQVRSVEDFHALKVATGIHLYLTQGNEKVVVVSAADPVYRNRIHTEVRNGVLNIYYENELGNWSDKNHKELKVYVSCIHLDGLHASSGAQVEVDGTLKSANLAMDFSSGSSFTGKVEAEDLQVEQCDVHVSSGGRVDISVEKAMAASAHSGGHVSYQGSGVITEIHTGSGGSISRK